VRSRLTTRLLLSHVAVALAATLTTLAVVRWLAPQLFDSSIRPGTHDPAHQSGSGAGNQGLREAVSLAVTRSMLTGGAVGVLVAALLGALVAWRLGKTLSRLSDATRRIAAGDYAARVPRPGTTELAAVADDVNTLGAALGNTETRRIRLLGEVAHEMRTPLTVIDGYVEAMIDDVMPLAPETLTQVSAETRRLRRLSEDLSALSHAEAGTVSLVRQRVDLRQVVRDSAERLRPQTDDAGLALEVDTGPNALPAEVDVDRIAQIVTNLVGNAIRATPPGGRIEVRCAQVVDEGRVSVQDTGEGIDPDQLDAIFERFYRAPGRRSTGSDSGSGIGLTISRRLAELHGGTLTAGSGGKGQGATFALTLPLVR